MICGGFVSSAQEANNLPFQNVFVNFPMLSLWQRQFFIQKTLLNKSIVFFFTIKLSKMLVPVTKQLVCWTQGLLSRRISFEFGGRVGKRIQFDFDLHQVLVVSIIFELLIDH